MSSLARPRGLKARPSTPRPSIRAFLADPGVSAPLKVVLRTWSSCDPHEAARDAGLLALALERVADEGQARDIWSGRRARHGGGDDRRPT